MPSRAKFLAASAAGLTTLRPVLAQPSLPILRVGGIQAVESSLAIWFAAELGYWQKAGLTVELQSFTNGNTAASAILGGSLDIALTTPLTLASAFARNVPFVVIAPAALNTVKRPSLLAVVPKTSTLRSVKELAGKTVGLNTLRTISELALDAWLAKNNVNIASVKVVEIPFSALLTSLSRGVVDVAFASEPQISLGVRAGDIRVFGDPMAAIGPRFVAGMWFTTTAFKRANPEAIKRFESVMYQTARWANSHAAESAPMVAKYTKLRLEDIQAMVRTDFPEQMRYSELQPPLDAALKFGFIQRPIQAQELTEGSKS